MNFITFNIVMLMLKMSLEQVNIIGFELSVIVLTLFTHLVVLDEYIELWSSTLSTLIGIIIITVVFLFQSLTSSTSNSQIKIPINFNITL